MGVKFLPQKFSSLYLVWNFLMNRQYVQFPTLCQKPDLSILLWYGYFLKINYLTIRLSLPEPFW